MMKTDFSRYESLLATALLVCLLSLLSPFPLIAEPMLSRSIFNKDVLIVDGKKYVVNADGSLSKWDSAQDKPCEEKKLSHLNVAIQSETLIKRVKRERR